MKQSELTQIMNEVIDETIEAVFEVFNEDIAPLLERGTPGQAIGKKYADWTPEDYAKARAIFGQAKLEDYIAPKEIADMYEQESTEV